MDGISNHGHRITHHTADEFEDREGDVPIDASHCNIRTLLLHLEFILGCDRRLNLILFILFLMLMIMIVMARSMTAVTNERSWMKRRRDEGKGCEWQCWWVSEFVCRRLDWIGWYYRWICSVMRRGSWCMIISAPLQHSSIPPCCSMVCL